MTGLFSPHPPLDAVALMHAGRKFSYREWFLEIEVLACSLARYGVRPGAVVALQATATILSAQMVYVTRVMGFTLFPLDPAMSGERRNRLLSEVGCDLLVTDAEVVCPPAGVRLVTIASFSEPAATEELPELLFAGTDADIQLIIATSGTEGNPKGVMLSGGNLAASIAAANELLRLRQNDLWLCCLPLYHIGGLSILYRSLDAGAGVLLHQGFDAAMVWTDLQSHRVSHISLVPAMLAQLLDISQDVRPPASLDLVLVGGGPLGTKLAERAHAADWPLCVSYGMSETASLCIAQDGELSGTVSCEVGRPLAGFELAISERGRIMLRGPAVMQGYANPDRSPGQGLLEGGWFETGDLGELGESGCLRVLGRADDVLISGGRNIHPVEVEAEIAACPGVDMVAITGQKDDRWGQILVALYTGSVSAGQLEEWCRSNTISSLRPRRFVQVAVLPYNAMGKLDRKGLIELLDQV